tara:strand:- start:1820 stop:3367 length:1548 start_codon:yes stop_codon:yes gene_type:complete
MFNLQYLGHAGWIIKNKNFKAMCDPWFGPQGAYYGEWFPFPENNYLLSQDLFEDLDFLYISHVHDDHFDPWVLEKIDKNTQVYIPNFLDKTLVSELKLLGFTNIKELDRNQTENVKNIKIKIIEDEGYLDADSCLYLDDGYNKILNLNDCHIDFSKLKEITGEIDLLLLQSSNAIWWPCAYDYDTQTKASLGSLKRKNLLNRALKYSRSLNAKHTVPNAGPPIFLSDNVDEWNHNRRNNSNPFVLMDDAVSFLQENGVRSHLLIPGDKFIFADDSENIMLIINEKKHREIYQNYNSYLQGYIKTLKNRRKNKQQATPQEVSTLIGKFRKQLLVLKRISKFYVKKIDFPVLFDFGTQGKWILDFSTTECLQIFKEQKYNYSFKLDPSVVSLVLQNKCMDFERYFLGCNFECSRSPDEYNEFLFVMLKYFDTKRFLVSESLYAKRSNVLEETFDIEHKGANYTVQKYCPHMYADLEKEGYIDGEHFVCPLHGWRFNLKDGKCEDKKHFCLNITKEKV